MRQPYLGWLTCPVCDAGSPAGISVCPRCRYQFRIPASRNAPEWEPSPPSESLPSRRRKRGQFSLGMASLGIAALALAFAWPGLILPAFVILCVILLLWALDTALRWMGSSLVAMLLIVAMIGVALGFLLART